MIVDEKDLLSPEKAYFLAHCTVEYLNGDPRPVVYRNMYKFWHLLCALEVRAPYSEVLMMLKKVQYMVDESRSHEEIGEMVIDWILSSERGIPLL